MRTIDILEQLDHDLAFDETAILTCGCEKTAKALYMQYSRAIKKHNFTPFLKVSRSGKTLTFSRPSERPVPVIQKEEKGKEAI